MSIRQRLYPGQKSKCPKLGNALSTSRQHILEVLYYVKIALTQISTQWEHYF